MIAVADTLTLPALDEVIVSKMYLSKVSDSERGRLKFYPENRRGGRRKSQHLS